MTFLLLRTFAPNALRAKAYSTLRERFADAPLRVSVAQQIHI
ncbi:hypothetical protein [Anabaena sp. CCY 0017]